MIKKFENFTNTKQITIVTFECDESVTALYIDGDLFKYGDYYHNKMTIIIEGFLLGLEYSNVEFDLKKIKCTNEDINSNVCENDQEPPKKLSEI